MGGLADLAFFVVPLVVIVMVYHLFCRETKTPRAAPNQNELETKVSNRSIVTITANEILLNADMMLIDSARSALEKLSQKACVYVIVVVSSMDEQKAVEPSMLSQFDPIIGNDRVLFCQTSLGRASMSRQLGPVAHVDFDPEVVHQVSIFHRAALVSTSDAISQHAAWRHTSFSDLVSSPDFMGIV